MISCTSAAWTEKGKLTVSSLQMAPTCVQHMMAVKMPKRSDSKTRRMRKMVVAGGLNDEHDATTGNDDVTE